MNNKEINEILKKLLPIISLELYPKIQATQRDCLVPLEHSIEEIKKDLKRYKKMEKQVEEMHAVFTGTRFMAKVFAGIVGATGAVVGLALAIKELLKK